PAGLELDGGQRCPPESFESSILGDGSPSLLSAARDSAPPIAGVSNQISIEDAGARQVSFHERDVLPFDPMRAEEILQKTERLPVAREHEGSRSVPVDPMNHESDRPAPVAMVEVIEHAREKGVPFPLRGRNRQETRRLVDDDKFVFLDEDGEPRPNPVASRTARMECDVRECLDFVPRLIARGTVDI